MNLKTMFVAASGSLLLFSASFAQDSTPLKVGFGNKYSIEIPHSMSIEPADKDTNILIQYRDAQYKFFYLAISKEPKVNVKLGFGETFDLETYYRRISEATAEQLKNGFTFPPKQLEINKISLIKGVIQGQAAIPIRKEEVDFFITKAMFEDNTNYYHLTIWTELKLANDYSTITDKIIQSISMIK